MNGPKRVLLLLRPSAARESLSELLEAQGFEVDAQPSTFRAVSSLARKSRDVVIVGLDDLLDEELEVVRVIREECPHAFLILTLTHVNRRKAQRALEMGADCYVLEPLRPEEIVAALKHLPAEPTKEPAAEEPTPEPVLERVPEEPTPEPLQPEEVHFVTPALVEETPAPAEQEKPEEPRPARAEGPAVEEPPPFDASPPAATGTAETEEAPDRLASLRKLGASVAHEINNPLTTLCGWIQLLLKKADGNQDLRRTLVNMKEEADRIADVVRELSAIAEPELAGRGPLDINTLADYIIEYFVSTNGNEDLRVKKIFTPDPPAVKADRDLLVRAVCDLLNSNYLDVGNSGSVVFTTTTGPDWVEFHVYEPGSQVDLEPLRRALRSVNLEEGESIGEDLALARCQEIISSHGGTFAAECDPREGLNFQLRLPKV